MKKFFLLHIFLLLIKIGSAQVTANLVVNPTPTAVISDWFNDNTVIAYVVTYQGQPGTRDIQAIIKTELRTTDGTLVASTDLSKATVYTISPGVRTFFARDVFPMQVMMFNETYRKTLERTGKLPSGTYQLTVQLVRPVTFDALTPPITRTFNLASIQLPVLMKPYKEEQLKAEAAQTAITFRWTPVVPMQTFLPLYHLQVFEILNNQTPLQALRANQPLLDVVLRAQTQYIWRPQLSFLDDSTRKRFIWAIQTLDVNRNPLVKTDGNGESRSEPVLFYIDAKTQVPVKDTAKNH